MRAFSQACENNKDPILEVLREWLEGTGSVLEIGSGTGQHARYFAEQLPNIVWQASDLPAYHGSIEAWREGHSGNNLPPPLEIDVTRDNWNVDIPEAVFTANTLHIMPWEAVGALFEYLGRHAPAGSLLLVYGPFNYQGSYTSDSNARFDEWLAATHPGGGIRDFEAVDLLAGAAGYELAADHPMPANNRMLVWRQSAA